MSQIVTTELGRFRVVADGGRRWWLWECPKCKEWASLAEVQMEGRVSVNHENTGCTYHETHVFAKTLVAAIAARMLTRGANEPMFEEDAG